MLETITTTTANDVKPEAVESIPSQKLTYGAKLRKALMSPQVLIMLLICLFLFVRFLTLRAPSVATPHISLSDVAETATQVETVELVSYDAELLERPIIRELEFGLSTSDKVTALLDALKQTLDIWPSYLELAAVFVADLDAQDVLVLDFVRLPTTNKLSLKEEWRLIRSISSTLRRNDIPNWRILINHESSDVFLHHMSLLEFASP